MKLFKRLMTLTVCSMLAVFSFPGCSLFNRCRHRGSYTNEYDEQSHYKICSDCGEKFDVDNHNTLMTYDKFNRTQHYIKCQICNYRSPSQPHDLTEWSKAPLLSIRRCATEGCNYEERCTHANTITYVVEGDGHYTKCENCEADITEKTEHTYDIYTDLTETTHSLSCECGKVSGEIVSHDFEYECENGSHWQTCACGFTTDKVDCSYGDYVPDPDMHYKVCSVCEGKGMTGTHSYELTESRKRLCRDCSHEKRPLSILLGTWQYNDYRIYRLTLTSDWSYTIKDYGGTLIETGNYNVHYYTSLKGEISGTISFYATDGHYSSNSIQFTFKKDVTDKFTDKNSRTYTKK